MEASFDWLDDPRVFRVNKLPAHSDHTVFASLDEARVGESSLSYSLDGTWGFHYAENPGEVTPDYFAPENTTSRAEFGEILVPGHIQLQGRGQIQYINTLYPWDGQVFRRPPFLDGDDEGTPGIFSQAPDNPVGEYIKSFTLPKNFSGKDVHLQFDGVEQAMYIWLNGKFVGYSEDSYSRAEFDLTPFLEAGENLLAVSVFKLSTAAFIEDQDMFRFSGIFRSVRLLAVPTTNIVDLDLKPTVAENGDGVLAVKATIAGDLAGTVTVTLLDDNNEQLANAALKTEAIINTSMTVPNVTLWTHRHPALYKVIVTVKNNDGLTLAVVPYEIGFRTITLTDDKRILLNDVPLRLNGVNRHEWRPERGRAITLADMELDMKLMTENHINAVRTSHYPNQVPWYFLADRAGIYLMAETNLESHGTWQKMGAIEPSYNVPGSHVAWLDVVMDRAKANYEQFKNHASVLFWSLGNESFAGDNIAAMNAYFKTVDPSRITHYEGVFHNRKYEDVISDVESRMYASPADIRAYLAANPKKPYMNCEFMHSMGNSVGGLDEYMVLYDEFPSYVGGFIWDFVDQALWQTDPVTGRQVLRYGGDFNDRHADYEFSGDGIFFADRTPKPALQEVKYYYDQYED
jgi:beta-galactosidase